MKAPSFWQELFAAFFLTLLAATSIAVLRLFVGATIGLKLIAVGLTAIYLLHLLRKSDIRAGKIVAVLSWLVVCLFLFIVDPSFVVWLAFLITTIWIVRAFYIHGTLSGVFADMLLNIVAITAALATSTYTHSFWLTVWVFFLIQALHIYIPDFGLHREHQEKYLHNQFDQAYARAEAALRQYANQFN